MTSRLPLFSVFVATLLAAAGCAPTEDRNPPAGRWVLPIEERADDPFPRVYTDRKGKETLIPRPPQRIASATLFTDVLLLDICPRERIAALHEVSKNPLFSPVAERSLDFPRHITPDPETVLAARPDLVFLAGFSDSRYETLVQRPGCTIVRMYRFESIGDIQQNLRAVGYILGLDRQAEQLVQKMQACLEAVAKNGDRRRFWRLVSWADGYSAGDDTTFNHILDYVGARNLVAEAGVRGTTKLGAERLLAMQPDAIVVGAPKGKEEEVRGRLLRVVALGRLRAVQDDRILFVPNNLLLSASHYLAGAAECIAETLDRWGHP